MVEFLKVILSPHIVWGGILVFFAFRFKSNFSQLLKAITDRVKNVQGYKKTKEGHELTFRKEQSSENDKILPNTSDNPPTGSPEKIDESIWSEDSTENITLLRELVKPERAMRYLWKYRYLNYFFARHTQLVLDWFVGLESSPSYQLFDNFWFQLIPDKEERQTVIDVLSAHFLIQLTEGDIMRLPQKVENIMSGEGHFHKLVTKNNYFNLKRITRRRYAKCNSRSI